MRFFNLLPLAATSLAVSVSFDRGYDDPNRSLTVVSCSDGINGLMTKYKWQTQGQIPRFPYIGGAEAVAGWNSPNCGTCWTLSWNGRSINMLAIDHAAGFNIGLRAMNDLTNGAAEQVGRVEATATQAPLSVCGL